MRLRHAGDRGRNEQHAGDEEDVRSLFMPHVRRGAAERHSDADETVSSRCPCPGRRPVHVGAGDT